MSVFAWLWMATAAVAADCPDDASLDVDAAIAAFESQDLPRFLELRGGLLAAIPCLDDPLKPRTAARLHLAQGLSRFLEREMDAAVVDFRAAAFADLTVNLSDDISVPPEHPLLKLAAEGHGAEPPAVAVVVLDGGDKAIINGDDAPTRPVDLPFVYQVERDGAVVGSWYIEAGAALPDAPETTVADAPPDPVEPVAEVEPPVVVELPMDPPPGKSNAAVPALGGVAGAFALGAVGLTVAARAKAGTLGDYDSRDEVESAAAAANTLGFAGQGLGGAAVVTAGLAVGFAFGGS